MYTCGAENLLSHFQYADFSKQDSEIHKKKQFNKFQTVHQEYQIYSMEICVSSLFLSVIFFSLQTNRMADKLRFAASHYSKLQLHEEYGS